MMTNELIWLLFRWLHIVPVIVLVGGTLFMRFSWVPSAEAVGASDELRESVRKRWARLVMISVLFLLVSGLYNAGAKAMAYDLTGAYNGLLLVKIVLGLAVFYLASVLSGRSSTARRFREREIYWLNILCVLMLVLVLIAGFMKIDSGSYPRKIKDEKSAAVTSHPIGAALAVR